MLIGINVKVYSTKEVADMLGVHKLTLLRWLYAGKVREPKHVRIATQNHRFWSSRDVARLKKFKEKNYRKKPRRK